MTARHITKDEAAAAATAAAFTTEYGELVVHCFAGGFGADWSLEGVLDAIAASSDRAWVPHLLDHDLAVIVNGKVRNFQVKAPEVEA